MLYLYLSHLVTVAHLVGWFQGFDNLFSYHQVMKRRKFRKACLYVTSRERCMRSYRMKFSLLQLYRLKGEDCKDFY